MSIIANNITDLPEEILELIMSKMDGYQIHIMGTMSRKMRAISKSSCLTKTFISPVIELRRNNKIIYQGNDGLRDVLSGMNGLPVRGSPVGNLAGYESSHLRLYFEPHNATLNPESSFEFVKGTEWSCLAPFGTTDYPISEVTVYSCNSEVLNPTTLKVDYLNFVNCSTFPIAAFMTNFYTKVTFRNCNIKSEKDIRPFLGPEETLTLVFDNCTFENVHMGNLFTYKTISFKNCLDLTGDRLSEILSSTRAYTNISAYHYLIIEDCPLVDHLIGVRGINLRSDKRIDVRNCEFDSYMLFH
jgi:hypothetical protein